MKHFSRVPLALEYVFISYHKLLVLKRAVIFLRGCSHSLTNLNISLHFEFIVNEIVKKSLKNCCVM